MNPAPHEASPSTALAVDLEHDRRFVETLARSLCRDANVADDLVQEAWLRTRGSGGDGAHPRAWWSAVLRRLFHTHRRAEARRHEREARAARPEAQDGGADALVAFETRQRVLAAVNALDEPLRRALLLRFDRGWSAERIAREEGVPLGTVRSRLERALERLRERLGNEKEGIGWHGLALLACGTSPGNPSGSAPAFAASPRGASFPMTATLAVTGALALGGVLAWLRQDKPEAPVASVASGARPAVAPASLAEVSAPASCAERSPLGEPNAAVATGAASATAPTEDSALDRYWSAVRALRAEIVPYVEGANDTPETARHRARFREARLEHVRTHGLGWRAFSAHVTKQTGLAIAVSDALAATDPAPLELELDRALRLESLLRLLDARTPGGVLWRVDESGLALFTGDELPQVLSTVAFDVRDLFLDPAGFGVPEDERLGLPAPLDMTSWTLRLQALVGLGSWEREGAVLLFEDGKWTVENAPDVHAQVQELLDFLRTRVLADPRSKDAGEGRPWYLIGSGEAEAVHRSIERKRLAKSLPAPSDARALAGALEAVLDLDVELSPKLAAAPALPAFAAAPAGRSVAEVLQGGVLAGAISYRCAGGALELTTPREPRLPVTFCLRSFPGRSEAKASAWCEASTQTLAGYAPGHLNSYVTSGDDGTALAEQLPPLLERLP